jgi:hypothetical protein
VIVSYHMVVGFTTTYAISAYHNWCCEFESRSGWGVQHYVTKLSVTCDKSDAGPCDAAISKYYYDTKARRCKHFLYGGCQGNRNNFNTLRECEKKCSTQPGGNVTKWIIMLLCRYIYENKIMLNGSKKMAYYFCK